ncbi:unnamed protein product [Triticum aestivum]|uniref:F-box protein AT5G49610-like beta-propeller domain-containing protein n=1 Tax=Triticum aestivum TaxID=4565 RepID=A0A7H4LNR4_WHEAT|nr:unnamed protein product [Triticum aestivum]
MASQPPPAAVPTTITALGDDLLREIFLRLPSLPSLVRAAFACRAFLRAVRSSPAFRRSFRALHAPPLLALFLDPNYEVLPASPCPWRRSDPDLVAADFFNTRVPRRGDAHAPGWEISSKSPSGDGYLCLVSWSGAAERSRAAAYNPLTRALDLNIYRPGLRYIDIDLEFYTIPSAYRQGPSRVVCIRHHRQWRERVAVFSSDTMEWRIHPTSTLLGLRESLSAEIGTMMHGLIWWQNWMYDQIVVLDTATFQFSLIDVPKQLETEWDESTYKLGETKDEKLCIVDIKDNTLVSWFLASDEDIAFSRWMMYKEFPLNPIVKEFTGFLMEEEGCDARVELVEVIDGFVYLSIFYVKDTQSRELYLSLCLETSEMSELFHDAYRDNVEVHPYVMAWPPSLLPSKEDSETEVTGYRVADDGPVGTEEASSILVTALQSLSQALMDGSDSNKELVVELDDFLLDSTNETAVELAAFLRPTEDDKDSLMSKIITLDAQLMTARDRILRISV